MISNTSNNNDGYTAIEVLAVIILAVFLSVAFMAYYRHSDNDLTAQTNILKNHIRYAQSRAMNTDTNWGVRFKTDQRAYWLFKVPDIEDQIPFPGQTADRVDLGAMGLDITGSDFNISFDSWGRPTLTNRTFSGGRLSFNLNRGGIDGDAVTIAENTGFIP